MVPVNVMTGPLSIKKGGWEFVSTENPSGGAQYSVSPSIIKQRINGEWLGEIFHWVRSKSFHIHCYCLDGDYAVSHVKVRSGRYIVARNPSSVEHASDCVLYHAARQVSLEPAPAARAAPTIESPVVGGMDFLSELLHALCLEAGSYEWTPFSSIQAKDWVAAFNAVANTCATYAALFFTARADILAQVLSGKSTHMADSHVGLALFTGVEIGKSNQLTLSDGTVYEVERLYGEQANQDETYIVLMCFSSKGTILSCFARPHAAKKSPLVVRCSQDRLLASIIMQRFVSWISRDIFGDSLRLRYIQEKEIFEVEYKGRGFCISAHSLPLDQAVTGLNQASDSFKGYSDRVDKVLFAALNAMVFTDVRRP